MIFGFDSLVLSFVEEYFSLCAFIRSVKRFWYGETGVSTCTSNAISVFHLFFSCSV